VLYLLAVAVGIFFLPALWQVGIACAVHMGLWLAVGLPARRLLRQVLKLWGFAVFITLSYALMKDDPATDRWIGLSFFGTEIPINTTGALTGVTMVVRIVTVILASQICRVGDPRAVASGLGKLGLPRVAAVSMDTVLALLGDDERHGSGRGRGDGSGRGGGGGRKRYLEEKEAEARGQQGFWASVRRMGRGDVGPIMERLSRQIDRAERHLEGQELEERLRARARDIAVIAGLSLTMLGIKALKILPAIPFAPGHKLVLLTPLYIVASMMTRARFGATLVGATMGTVAFLMGDGKYGIFEIAKHVTPGLVCDLCVPALTAGGRRPGAIGWSLFGGVIAAARFATIFLVTLSVQAPAVAFAFLLPGMAVHVTFGVVSGWVSHHLVRAADKLRSTTEKPKANGKEAA
jgi:hypothetical protein